MCEAMTPKALSKMTLAEFEALAQRLEKAARTYREAMAVVGGQAAPYSTPSQVPWVPGPVTSIANPQATVATLQTPERAEYLSERQLEQKRWLAQQKGNPEREAKLSQFAHDGEPDKDAPVTTEPLETMSEQT